MAYCFMSTEKIKSYGVFTRKYEHNYRTGNVPNADINRKHLNEEIIPMKNGTNYLECFKNTMAQLNHTPRKNAVFGIEVVMTYNPMEVDDNFDMDKWKEANIDWLKETFGEDNIVSAVMHRDEGPDNGKSAHIHAVVLPIQNGKLNCRHFLSGKAKMVQLQTSYGKAMKEVGLTRGLEGSVASHQKVRQFYDSLNKSFDEKLPKKEEHETDEEYYERVNTIRTNEKLKWLGEKNKMKREIDELKTHLKMARFESLQEARDNIEKAKDIKKKAEEEKKAIEEQKKDLESRLEDIKEMETRLRNFNILMDGLNNHPDRAFAESLSEEISKLLEWEVAYEEQLAKEEEEREECEGEEDEI